MRTESSVPNCVEKEPAKRNSVKKRVHNRQTKVVLLYGTTITVFVFAIWLVINLGQRLETQPARVSSASTVESGAQTFSGAVVRNVSINSYGPLGILLLQIVLVLTLSRWLGAIVLKIGQPRVIGEVFSGILLGPSFFGMLLPNTMDLLFSA